MMRLVKAGLLLSLAGAIVPAGFAAKDPTDARVLLVPADQSAAVKSLLTPGDLGASWKGGPETPNAMKIPVCPIYKPNNSDLVVTGHAESYAEQANLGIQVDADVAVFRSAKQVDVLFQRMLQPKLGSCLKFNLLKTLVGSQVDVELGTVTRLPIAKIGTHTALFRVAMAVKSGSSTVGVNSDFLYVSTGRTVFFVSVTSPEPSAKTAQTIETRVARLLVKRAVA